MSLLLTRLKVTRRHDRAQTSAPPPAPPVAQQAIFDPAGLVTALMDAMTRNQQDQHLREMNNRMAQMEISMERTRNDNARVVSHMPPPTMVPMAMLMTMSPMMPPMMMAPNPHMGVQGYGYHQPSSSAGSRAPSTVRRPQSPARHNRDSSRSSGNRGSNRRAPTSAPSREARRSRRSDSYHPRGNGGRRQSKSRSLLDRMTRSLTRHEPEVDASGDVDMLEERRLIQEEDEEFIREEEERCNRDKFVPTHLQNSSWAPKT